ncbi:hypothetical protein EA58_14750 [Photobacterium galatheae]|uniref:Uncharacterized protein n=1 Tax=Photobacterium galatheae TaxID=1654360 RepID=A0A066RTH2_9GAMM|nr:hypothetical protein EA58_14750 [Photobacterium galatheae]
MIVLCRLKLHQMIVLSLDCRRHKLRVIKIDIKKEVLVRQYFASMGKIVVSLSVSQETYVMAFFFILP